MAGRPVGLPIQQTRPLYRSTLATDTGNYYRQATQAADYAGYPGFVPDACLINEYKPGTRLSLHQDKNEVDFTAPIVSLSLGLSARFKFAGKQRSDKTQTYLLERGDMLVWGGKSRLNFHGIMPIKDAYHSLLGSRRINLTLRKAS